MVTKKKNEQNMYIKQLTWTFWNHKVINLIYVHILSFDVAASF
jgi:hypothetical protein